MAPASSTSNEAKTRPTLYDYMDRNTDSMPDKGGSCYNDYYGLDFGGSTASPISVVSNSCGGRGGGGWGRMGDALRGADSYDRYSLCSLVDDGSHPQRQQRSSDTGPIFLQQAAGAVDCTTSRSNNLLQRDDGSWYDCCERSESCYDQCGADEDDSRRNLLSRDHDLTGSEDCPYGDDLHLSTRRFSLDKKPSFKICARFSFKIDTDLPSNKTSPAYDDHAVIEVAPGEYWPLRSAAETLAAIEDDYFMPTSCATCCQTIFCIQDAKYVLCPECRVVSPMEDDSTHDDDDDQDSASCRHNARFGVGLGFTMEDLAKWQPVPQLRPRPSLLARGAYTNETTQHCRAALNKDTKHSQL
jgi:hypothetical protein